VDRPNVAADQGARGGRLKSSTMATAYNGRLVGSRLISSWRVQIAHGRVINASPSARVTPSFARAETDAQVA
jgi:hypothetical protein